MPRRGRGRHPGLARQIGGRQGLARHQRQHHIGAGGIAHQAGDDGDVGAVFHRLTIAKRLRPVDLRGVRTGRRAVRKNATPADRFERKTGMAARRTALLSSQAPMKDLAMPPHASAPRMGAPEWIALLALSTLWGGSFFFYKVLVAELPPFTVVLGRVSIAALALHILLLARRDPLRLAPHLLGQF